MYLTKEHPPPPFWQTCMLPAHTIPGLFCETRMRRQQLYNQTLCTNRERRKHVAMVMAITFDVHCIQQHLALVTQPSTVFSHMTFNQSGSLSCSHSNWFQRRLFLYYAICLQPGLGSATLYSCYEPSSIRWVSPCVISMIRRQCYNCMIFFTTQCPRVADPVLVQPGILMRITWYASHQKLFLGKISPSLPPSLFSPFPSSLLPFFLNISLYVHYVHMYEGQVIQGVISHV